ncbi:MAG: hypothetical protein QW343_01500 [Candidatus Norongarragalinales archaeon]
MRGMRAKRGVFYSLMTLLLLAPIVLLAFYYSQAWPQSTQRIVSRSVGFSAQNFAESIAADFPRAIEISGRSAAAAAVNHVVSSGSPVDDARLRVIELGRNGTFYGSPSFLMMNNSLESWVSRLALKGAAFGFNASVSILYYSAAAFDSFHLFFNASILVNASNTDYEITFSRIYYASKIISIEGLEDPLYALNTRGLAHRSITANSSRVYGVSALDAAALNASFVAASDGPCFFDRLENKKTLSASCAAQAASPPGLETLVNTQQLAQQGLEVDANASVIDHQYFSEPPHASGYAVNGSAFSWLKLDTAHAQLYGVELKP